MSYHGHGRVLYTTIKSNDPLYTWNYYCDEFEELLKIDLIGRTLKRVYVGLCGYLDGAKRDENCYDFTYMGGTVLMIFDGNMALELDIRAQGMIAHRFHKVSDLSFRTTKDYPPSDIVLSDSYFYDLRDEFALSFESRQIIDIEVCGTNSYAFSAQNFDEDKAVLAMYQERLPGSIHFLLDNGVDFTLLGDQIEYFFIVLREY